MTLARRAGALGRAMRPRQWTKNAVVLAAYAFGWADASQGLDLGDGVRALAAAGLFCLLSSAVYLFNDVRDRDADRRHPAKRARPVASGELPVSAALAAAAALLALALGLSATLSPRLASVAAAYAALQAAYSTGLKRVFLLDVVLVASGFVARALAGAVAVGGRISPWLLACTFLLALFLGLCKRRHERVNLEDADALRPALAGRGTRTLDAWIAAASAATVACYALYALLPSTAARFGTRALGWTIPFVALGVARYLHLVYRRDLGDQPEQVLLTDGWLIADILAYGAAVGAAFLTRPGAGG